MDDVSAEAKAKFVYEAARLHAAQLGCPVTVSETWEERDDKFRNDFTMFVTDVNDGIMTAGSGKDAHDFRMSIQKREGWKYGEVYDPENKITPNFVEYEDLDPKEKVKDEVLLRLMDIARDCM